MDEQHVKIIMYDKARCIKKVKKICVFSHRCTIDTSAGIDLSANKAQQTTTDYWFSNVNAVFSV